MPLVSKDGLNIFFAHVPKAGGSSVQDYLIRRFGKLQLLDLDRTKNGPLKQTGLIMPASHLTAADLEDLLPVKLDYSFAVVRDPVARALSEYRFQRGASRMSRLDFSTWLRVMIASARKDPRTYDNHIRPQTDLVSEACEIFRLEDGFDAMIARLDEVTGTTTPDIKVGHLLKRARTEIPLSAQDVALIEDFYAEDYARFGYAAPDRSGLSSDGLAGPRSLFGAAMSHAVVFKQRRDWLR
ncbi:sulfotransferase family 2 domain-containing protein [Rhodobacteraceae bacterium NNCM2]|nr:sulfotransferase family 2 domain-containing protein [Coraliihabitans acroporae]